MKDDFPLPLGDVSWQQDAACLGYFAKAGEDLFFPPDNPGGPKQGKGVAGEAARVRKAKRICLSCPVRIRCLEFAVANSCLGIWGGTTDSERRRIGLKGAA